MKITTTKAHLEDLSQFHPRAMDIQECAQWSGRHPRDSVALAIIHGHPVTALWADDRLVGFYGCIYSADRYVGTPWLLGTDLLEQVPKTAWKRARGVVASMLAPCMTLRNFVHADNKKAQRWLSTLGFTIRRDLPKTTERGGLFYPFVRTKQCVTQT